VKFVLASASPARLATLRNAGLDPEVIVSHVDEDAFTAEDPAALAQLLAEQKATAVANLLTEPALVLGCDSVLELDGEALGKPGTREVAVARWKQMRGRTGVLRTGHALYNTRTRSLAGAVGSTSVHFRNLSDEEIDAYVATGEPMDVAGAFTIDGLGGWFIDEIQGDPHTVVGVSLPLVYGFIRGMGYTLGDLGWPTTSSGFPGRLYR
jgi:septum formation protein